LTSWTVYWNTGQGTSRSTSHSTTTTYTSYWNVSTTTTTAWTTSWNTTGTTTYNTTYSYSKTTSKSTSKNTTGTYITYWSTTATWTTAWSSSFSYTTYWNTSQATDDGVIECIVEGSLVQLSTSYAKAVEELVIGQPLLTMDGGMNVDTSAAMHAFRANEMNGDLSNDDTLTGIRKFTVQGIVDINNGLVKTTEDHIHVVKRDGVWRLLKASALVLGDILYHLTQGEITITSLVDDMDTQYTVYSLDVEPNDTFFVNGILTHNRKDDNGLCYGDSNPEVCDPGSFCYDPCSPYAWDWGCQYECRGDGLEGGIR
jgi:hypothetical protein